MTLKSGDRVRAANDMHSLDDLLIVTKGAIGTFRVDMDGEVSVMFDGETEEVYCSEEEIEPLPAKPEDVREELAKIIREHVGNGYFTIFEAPMLQRIDAAADAILAKFPKMLEGQT